MFTTKRCPTCKTPLSREVLNGLCPRCVLAAAIDDDAADSTGPWPPLAAGSDSAFIAPSVEKMREKFPQLEITEMVGSGGMGAVYRARQPGLDRVVAIKILPAERGSSGEFADRFTREARTLALLNHPNIVAVYDFGQKDDLYYIIMEYVEGTTLRQLIKSGQTRTEQTLEIISQVSSALQYAHELGVIHRDIKPENVLIDLKGRVKIADFGLAKLTRRNPYEGNLTRTQQVMGTLRYMAPEQIEATRNVDHRADIYSLGVVLYEMLTRELPLGRFPLPSETLGTDPRLDQIVVRALEKSPDRRYQHAGEIRADLEALSRGTLRQGGVASPRLLLSQVAETGRRLPRILQFCLLGLLALILVPTLIGMIPVFVLGALFFIMGVGVARLFRHEREPFALKTRSFLGKVLWTYNPIVWLFHIVFHRTTLIIGWAMVCIGLYVGIWWPAWHLVAKSNNQIYYGPGVIDSSVWPYMGRVMSSVRLTPTRPLYESLTATLQLQGTWQGFNDARCGVTPHRVDQDRILLQLLTHDGKTHELVYDNTGSSTILYQTPKGDAVKLEGPIDVAMVQNWLRRVLENPAIEKDLESHAKAVCNLLNQACSNYGYHYFQRLTIQMDDQTIAGNQGRLPAVVSSMYMNTPPIKPGSNQRNFEFKYWTGRQSTDISEDHPIIPIGVGVSLGVFMLGVWLIRMIRPAAAAAPAAPAAPEQK